jgi:hypothetical protein
MRVRSTSSLSKASVSMVDNPGGTTVFNSTVSWSGESRTISDVPTPNFQSRKSNGEVFMNPYGLTIVRRRGDYVSRTFTGFPAWGTRTWTGPMATLLATGVATPPELNSWIDRAKAQTLLESYANVAKVDAQALVTVAEAKKTAQMIARPFGAATDLINRMVARRASLLKTGLTLSAASAAAWLEIRFGWRPVLLDIKNIAGAYATRNSAFRHQVVRESSRAKQEKQFSAAGVTTGSGYGLTSWRTIANSTWDVKVGSGVLYQLKDENPEASLARQFGYRLADIPASMWELVPLSFVVDRFFTVGAWLDAMTPKPGVTIMGNWTTVVLNLKEVNRASGTIVVTDTAPNPDVVYTGNLNFGSHVSQDSTITRVVGQPHPVLPVINNKDLGFDQLVDHAALIRQRLLKN